MGKGDRIQPIASVEAACAFCGWIVSARTETAGLEALIDHVEWLHPESPTRPVLDNEIGDAKQ